MVDDDAANASLLCSLLEPVGFQVTVAYDGPDAIRLSKKLKPDLILLDLLMPGMDGLSVIEELKRDSLTDSTRIIGISASLIGSPRKDQFISVTDAFVEKPVCIPLLMKTIGDICELSWVYREPGDGEDADTTRAAGADNVPPKEVLEVLHLAFMKGDYRGMERILADIAADNTGYASFGKRLTELLSVYDEKGIRELLMEAGKISDW